MGTFHKIGFDRFDLGLYTAPDAMDLPIGAATIVQNCDFENFGQMSKSKGAKLYTINGNALPTMPTSLAVDGVCAFEVTRPSSKDMLLITGTVSGLRKFYLTPYRTLAGAWVENAWLDLTEAVTTTLNGAPGSNTSFTLTSADVSATTDYYKGWWVQIWDITGAVSLGWDLVLAYNGTTKVITTKFGIASAATGDHVLLCRNPIFKGISATPGSGNASVADLEHFEVDDKCTFSVENERVHIYTGNGKSVSTAPDLHLSYVGTDNGAQGYFDDNDLDFQGFILEHAHPFAIENPEAVNDYDYISISNKVEAGRPLPYDASGTYNYWVFYGAVLYDGFQEGNHFYGPETAYASYVYRYGAVTDATTALEVTVTHRPNLTTPRKDEYSQTTDATGYNSVLPRRAKAILIYVARGRFTGSTLGFQFATPYFLIKTIPIDDSGWSGTGPYTYTFLFTGLEWDFAQEFDSVLNRGHIVERVGATANQAVKVAGSWVVGPVYTSFKRNDIIIIAPRTSKFVGGVVTPSVLPEKSIKLDSSPHGIPRIIAIASHLDRLLVFGKDTLGIAIVDDINSRFIESIPIGLTSKRGVQVIDDICYFTSKDGVYAFDGRKPVRISEQITTTWEALTNAQREACFTGINKKQLWIVAGSTLFVYDTLKNHWRNETLDLTWTGFFQGHSGELLATDGTSIYELDADSYTTARALRWKSGEINTKEILPRRLQAVYSASDLITVKIYDHEVSTSEPVDTVYLIPSETSINTKVSARAERMSVEILSESSLNALTIRKLEIGQKVLEKA